VKAHFEHIIDNKSQRLADLEHKTAQLERQLSDARMSLERELAQSPHDQQDQYPAAGGRVWPAHEEYGAEEHGTEAGSAFYVAPPLDDFDGGFDGACDSDYDGGRRRPPEDRTEVLLSHGRHGARQRGLTRRRKVAIAGTGVALVITVLVVVFTGGASWPPSVATVQSEITQACQNPDVASEPGQVNFACAKSTNQVLWVFSLLTSDNNPSFADPKTGRVGLEPITPSQGGEVAWSLNLHHPYDPSNPVDSLQVAARAINNIIGGATVIGANGAPEVQPGLESSPANCARYTGSAAVTSRAGFPSLCSSPVTTTAGQASLVADIFQKWLVGATPQAAQDAAVLFENANNPGDPRVQAILKHLPDPKFSA
jgi:hypothetical protein